MPRVTAPQPPLDLLPAARTSCRPQQPAGRLKKQQDALNAKISQAKSELEKQQLIKENSSYQITLTKQQIDLLEDKIVLINENIDEKETEIA